MTEKEPVEEEDKHAEKEQVPEKGPDFAERTEELISRVNPTIHEIFRTLLKNGLSTEEELKKILN